MENVIRLNKGMDIHIVGDAEKIVADGFTSKTYAIKPQDFIGNAPIPKMMVKEGDEVKAGDPLFYDKANPDIYYTAPVSGEVAEIRRGEKRSIAAVIILADSSMKYKEFKTADVSSISREDAISALKESGLWAAIRQRPYNSMANPADTPRDIFVSTFDSAPLAGDMNFMLAGQEDALQAGIYVLNALTEGSVHVGLNAKDDIDNNIFSGLEGCEKNWFNGPHPAGNVGIQIHNTEFVRKGEVVWHVGPQHLAMIGKLFTTGKLDTNMMICTGGPLINDPKYYNVYMGAAIEGLIENNINDERVRLIDGNVLTGKHIDAKNYIGYYNHQLSAIREGDDVHEFMGWLIPSYPRPSLSRTFLTGWGNLFSVPEKTKPNTLTHGEHRNFVVTGQYEQVLPMDIYPVQLLKSIIVNDFEQMEGLGIYEVAEEDLALCEFVCTSKTEVQAIIRDGLDYVQSQN